MPELNDCKRNALLKLGFSGTISDQMLAWLKSIGATSGHISDAWLEIVSVIVPIGAIQYWLRTQSNLTQAITERVNGVNLTTTICADDRNIIQQDGTVVTYGPNVAAFNVGVGMVVAGEATTQIPTNIALWNEIVNTSPAYDSGSKLNTLTFTGGDSAHRWSDLSAVTAGSSYTSSMIVMKGDHQFVQLTGSSGFSSSVVVNYDIHNVSLSSVGVVSPDRVDIIDLGDRVRMDFTTMALSSTATGRHIVTAVDSLASARLSSADIDGQILRIQYANFTKEAFASPPIDAPTMAATRAATTATDSGFVESGLLIDANGNGGVAFTCGDRDDVNYMAGINNVSGAIDLRAYSGNASKYDGLAAVEFENCTITSEDRSVVMRVTSTIAGAVLNTEMLRGTIADAQNKIGWPNTPAFNFGPSNYFTGHATLSTMVSNVRALRVDAEDNGATLDALGTPALWPVDNIRAGMGEAGKDIILDALTNGGVFFQNGNMTASIVGTDLQIEIGASVATIAVATVDDVLQSFAVLRAGQFHAEANLAEGAGVANPGFEPSNTFTQGSDNAGANHFEGTPTFPSMLIQDIS